MKRAGFTRSSVLARRARPSGLPARGGPLDGTCDRYSICSRYGVSSIYSANGHLNDVASQLRSALQVFGLQRRPCSLSPFANCCSLLPFDFSDPVRLQHLRLRTRHRLLSLDPNSSLNQTKLTHFFLTSPQRSDAYVVVQLLVIYCRGSPNLLVLLPLPQRLEAQQGVRLDRARLGHGWHDRGDGERVPVCGDTLWRRGVRCVTTLDIPE
jgi:hypothetical protein